MVKNPENLFSRHFDSAYASQFANSTVYVKDEHSEDDEKLDEEGEEETGQDGYQVAVTALYGTVSGPTQRNRHHQNLSAICKPSYS